MAKLNYGDESVVTLEGLSLIQHNPAQYGVEPDTPNGIFLLVKEIIDNSLDEARVDPNKPQVIDITFMKRKVGFQCIVKDQGRGVPLKSMARIFTTPGTSGKWKSGYVTSTGVHGVGSKATVAMSKKFVAVSRRPGEGSGTLIVEEAKIKDSTTNLNKKETSNGTLVFFEPDGGWLNNLKEFFDAGGAYDKLIELMEYVAVFNHNITFNIYEAPRCIDLPKLKGSADELEDLLNNHPKELVRTISSDMDIVEYAIRRNRLNQNIIWRSAHYHKEFEVKNLATQKTVVAKDKDTRRLAYHVDLFVTEGLANGTSIGSVNMININKSSIHIDMVWKALKDVLYDRVPDDQQEFFMDFYKPPVHITSAVDWENARFLGQDKRQFSDKLFGKNFKRSLISSMIKQNTAEDWDALYQLLKDDIADKFDAKYRKEFGSKSDKNLAFTLNKPRSYHECMSTNRDITELYICEGVSSGDYVKQHRDRDTQAVFELGGKPMNSIQSTFEDSLKNAVFADMVKVLNTSPRDTKLEDFRFGKIVILADADDDGYHISALLIGILHTINPQLLAMGKVMIASPPLYTVSIGRSKDSMFVRDANTLLNFKVDGYSALLKMELVVGNKRRVLEGEYLRAFCFLIHKIGATLHNISKKLVITPVVLEQLAYCIDDLKRMDFKALVKKLGLTACDYEEVANVLVMSLKESDILIPMEGLIEDLERLVIPQLESLNYKHCNIAITTLQSDVYKGELLGFMEIYDLFRKIDKQFKVERLKGVGELTAAELKLTCLNKDTRAFITVEGPKDVDRIFKLLGTDTATRKKIIARNVG